MRYTKIKIMWFHYETPRQQTNISSNCAQKHHLLIELSPLLHQRDRACTPTYGSSGPCGRPDQLRGAEHDALPLRPALRRRPHVYHLQVGGQDIRGVGRATYVVHLGHGRRRHVHRHGDDARCAGPGRARLYHERGLFGDSRCCEADRAVRLLLLWLLLEGSSPADRDIF